MEESIKIDVHKRTIDDKRSSPQFVNLSLSPTGTDSFTLDMAGEAAADAVVTATLTSDKNLRVIGTGHISLYQGSVAGANQIPGGSSINPADYEVAFWNDLHTTDGKNITFKAYILNNTFSSQAIHVRVNFRFIVEPSGVST